MSHSTVASNTTTTAFRPLDSTTAMRPARLVCPSCLRSDRTEVLAPMPAGKIEFHRCSGCGGVWFYEKDLDLALRATAECEWPAPSESSEKTERALQAIPIEKLWACPCCGGTLVAIRDRRGSGASVRRCLVCYGGWMGHEDVLKAADASTGVLSRIGCMIRTLLTR